MQELGKQFTEYKYDFKKLVRDICTSRTYQLATAAQREQRRATRATSPHGTIRRIRAETFLDCISEVTETKNKFPGLPLGARAVQIADGGVSQLLPDDVRPGDARNGLLVRGEAGADAVAIAAPAQRRHDDAADRGRQPDRPAPGGEEDAASRSSRSCTSAA